MIADTNEERKYLPDLYFRFLFEALYSKIKGFSFAYYRRKDILVKMDFVFFTPLPKCWFSCQAKWMLGFRKKIMEGSKEREEVFKILN